ncbi:hypothetical protein [Cupriavidus sp. Agwp_2]|uniref:hypothetical protein n=2 Tax=unclassified Cupriavidus TaxID=2640874 RepID=UPI00346100FA
MPGHARPGPVNARLRRLAAATIFVVVAGMWLAGVCARRAAIRAGCVGSVVHRGAILFKTKGPALQRNAIVGSRRLCRHDGFDVRRVSERKKRANADSVDSARFRHANPRMRISEMKFRISSLRITLSRAGFRHRGPGTPGATVLQYATKWIIAFP